MIPHYLLHLVDLVLDQHEVVGGSQPPQQAGQAAAARLGHPVEDEDVGGGQGGRVHRGHGHCGRQEEGLLLLPAPLVPVCRGAVLPAPVDEGQAAAEEQQAAELPQGSTLNW